MARLEVKDFVDIATGSQHEATSWQVAKDKDFTLIVDESIRDFQNVKTWYTMLPKRPEDGTGYYKAEEELWARIQIHLGTTDSNWFVIGPKRQNYQEIDVVEKEHTTIHTNTDELRMKFTK